MAYVVYAELSNGKVLRYKKKLKTESEAKMAMYEMDADLRPYLQSSGVTAMITYKEDGPAAVPKTAPNQKTYKVSFENIYSPNGGKHSEQSTYYGALDTVIEDAKQDGIERGALTLTITAANGKHVGSWIRKSQFDDRWIRW